MKKIMENLLIRSIMMGIAVFLFGFVGMNIWWNILPRNFSGYNVPDGYGNDHFLQTDIRGI